MQSTPGPLRDLLMGSDVWPLTEGCNCHHENANLQILTRVAEEKKTSELEHHNHLATHQFQGRDVLSRGRDLLKNIPEGREEGSVFEEDEELTHTDGSELVVVSRISLLWMLMRDCSWKK